MSPRSDSSGSLCNVNTATSRWFGLLASDVTSANYSFASPLLTSRHNTQSHHSSVSPNIPVAVILPDTPQEQVTNPGARPPASGASPNGDTRLQRHQILTENEFFLLQHFTDHVSSWLDLNDPLRHFSIMVPHLATGNEGLRKAIFALAARDLTIKPLQRSPNFQPDRSLAVEYYHETLQYLQQAMKDEKFLRSDELLATVLIISTYELIDGAGQAWERHLKGIFWIQRSLDSNGESGGLRQAAWWAWLRQDLWASYRERRKLFTVFVPTKPYSTMDQWEIAEKIVYLAAQVVNFASDEETEAGKVNQKQRLQAADRIARELDLWLKNLTPHFQPLPSPGPRGSNPFRPTLIHPQAFGNVDRA